jgi:hypothetical protein
VNFVEMLIYGATTQMKEDCNLGRIHVEQHVWAAALAFRWFFFPPRHVILTPAGPGRWAYQ